MGLVHALTALNHNGHTGTGQEQRHNDEQRGARSASEGQLGDGLHVLDLDDRCFINASSAGKAKLVVVLGQIVGDYAILSDRHFDGEFRHDVLGVTGNETGLLEGVRARGKTLEHDLAIDAGNDVGRTVGIELVYTVHIRLSVRKLQRSAFSLVSRVHIEGCARKLVFVVANAVLQEFKIAGIQRNRG